MTNDKRQLDKRKTNLVLRRIYCIRWWELSTQHRVIHIFTSLLSRNDTIKHFAFTNYAVLFKYSLDYSWPLHNFMLVCLIVVQLFGKGLYITKQIFFIVYHFKGHIQGFVIIELWQVLRTTFRIVPDKGN